MTPEELRTFFLSHGLRPKMSSFITSSGNIKYKLAKNSLQKYNKSDVCGWIKIWSAYYKDISINPETGKLRFEKMI